MKILMSGLFDPDKNDACKIHFIEVAAALARQGCEVDILIPRGEGKLDFPGEPVKIGFLNRTYSESLVSLIPLSLRQVFGLAARLSPDHDAVYLRWRALPGFFFRLAARLKGFRPVFVSEHNGWVELETLVQRESKFLSRLAGRLQVWDAASVHGVAAVTPGIAEKLVSRGIPPEKIRVVDNGTNTSLFHPLPDKADLKLKLVGGPGPVIGFCGNMARWQGVDRIVEGFVGLSREFPSARLLLIGSGLDSGRVGAMIERLGIGPRVVLRSEVDYREMNPWLNAMDLALAPKSKKFEEIGYSPLKVRDYAAAGLPVLATDVRGLREHKVQGWLETFDPDDPDSLGRSLRALLSDPDRLREMGEKARAYAEASFSWDRAARQILDFILELKAGKHA